MSEKTSSMATVIEARKIGAKIGQRTLFDGVSFSIDRGQVVAILGPNGAGKTTLLRTLIGTQKSTAGHVIRHGIVGYVPQRTETAFAYSVRDMISMGRTRHFGLISAPGPLDAEIIERCAVRVGISGLMDRTFDTLSGGERQLVLIARALSCEPSALLLDEPAAALDLRHQAEILSLLVDIARTENMAIVFTTHHPQHAAAIANTAILLRESNLWTGDAELLLTDVRLSALFEVPVVRLPLPHSKAGRSTLVAVIEPHSGSSQNLPS